jgi:hypothetical protein
MALATEAKRIAAEFELPDSDVKKIGLEFIEQMSAHNQHNSAPNVILTVV